MFSLISGFSVVFLEFSGEFLRLSLSHIIPVVKGAGDGAFLNAARLTASTAPFRCDASFSRRLTGTWNVVDELN